MGPGDEFTTLEDGTITVTVPQAAAHAHVKEPTVYSWIRRYQLERVGIHDNGRGLYRLSDIARVEKLTRGAARRNVGLMTVATQDIADHDAVLVRLDCGHLKILSQRHAPQPGRTVACFECSAQSAISYAVEPQQQGLRAA